MIRENKISQPIVEDEPCTSKKRETCQTRQMDYNLTFLLACWPSETIGAFACAILAHATVETLTTALWAVLISKHVHDCNVWALVNSLLVIQNPGQL